MLNLLFAATLMPIFINFIYFEKNRHFGAAKSKFNISGLKANSDLKRS